MHQPTNGPLTILGCRESNEQSTEVDRTQQLGYSHLWNEQWTISIYLSQRGQRTVVGKKGRYCQCGRAKDVKTAHSCQRCGWFVAQFFRLEHDSAQCIQDCPLTHCCVWPAEGRIAISTTSSPRLRIDRHWRLDPLYLLLLVEAKFSVDDPVDASSQWQVCRWRHQWIDVHAVLVKQVSLDNWQTWPKSEWHRSAMSEGRSVSPVVSLIAALLISALWLHVTWLNPVVVNFYRAMHFSAKRGLAIACRLSVRLWRW